MKLIAVLHRASLDWGRGGITLRWLGWGRLPNNANTDPVVCPKSLTLCANCQVPLRNLGHSDFVIVLNRGASSCTFNEMEFVAVLRNSGLNRRRSLNTIARLGW